MNQDEKWKPVQVDRKIRRYGCENALRINKIIAEEAYKEYADCGHGSQSCDRLHQRGGFSIGEIITLLYGRIKRLEGDKSGRHYGGMTAFYQPPDDQEG